MTIRARNTTQRSPMRSRPSPSPDSPGKMALGGASRRYLMTAMAAASTPSTTPRLARRMADAELRDLQMLPWIYPFLRTVHNVLRTLRCVRAERSAIEQRQAASVYPEARRIGCLEGQSRQLSVCFMYDCVCMWPRGRIYPFTLRPRIPPCTIPQSASPARVCA